MEHDHDSHTGSNAPAAVVEVDIKNAFSGSDYACLEACFRELRGLSRSESNTLPARAPCSLSPRPSQQW